MSLNSLPYATQEQIDQMNKAAQTKYGVPAEEVTQEVSSNSLETEEASEVIAQGSDAPAEQVQEEAAPTPEQPKQKAHGYSKEENLAMLRERARKAEAERELLARQLQSFQQNPIQDQSKKSNLGADDLVEGKHLAELQQKINMIEAEARLRYRFPDFDKVMSQSNVASLAEMYPDIAKTISQSNSDPYSQAVTAYTMIKNLGIHADDFQQEKKVAATNAAKPRPLTSISPQQGDTPLSRANAFANGLTDDLRKSLQKEMFESMKNRY